MNGSDVSTSSSCTQYFSYNGTGGGSYQFTLQLDVRDALNTLSTATKVVTAYSSGGGDGGGPVAQDGTLIEQLVLPIEFSISQNYPNPFNPETEITFGLPEPSHVVITIIDMLGREVGTLTDGHQSPGFKRLRWNATDANGKKLGSGIYFCRIRAKGETGKEFTSVTKMVLMR